MLTAIFRRRVIRRSFRERRAGYVRQRGGTGRAEAQAEPGTKSRGMRDPRGFAYEPGGR
jgi:hypothetical protein